MYYKKDELFICLQEIAVLGRHSHTDHMQSAKKPSVQGLVNFQSRSVCGLTVLHLCKCVLGSPASADVCLSES